MMVVRVEGRRQRGVLSTVERARDGSKAVVQVLTQVVMVAGVILEDSAARAERRVAQARSQRSD
eukprot:3026762-Prymnesium_polylepis.1